MGRQSLLQHISKLHLSAWESPLETSLTCLYCRIWPHVFCIPVCCELDLKKAAKAADDKNIELVAVKDLLGLTGYIRGGCSPVGMKKKYPTHFDETCILWDEIAVSAGERGHQMILHPESLAAFVDADLTDIT